MAESPKTTKAKARKASKTPTRSKAKRPPAEKKAPPPPGTVELLSMDEAIALLKTTRATFYRWLRSGKVSGIKLGRQWRFERSEIDRLLKGEEPTIELRADIGPLIDQLSAKHAKLGGVHKIRPNESSLDHAVRLMINCGVALDASDIHIEPFEDAVHLRYRVHGVLGEEITFDRRLLPAVVAIWKSRAGCDVREKIRPQDGRIEAMVHGPNQKAGRRIDMRLSFLPSQLGEAITIRLLRPDAVKLGLDMLTYAPDNRARLEEALAQPNGIIIATGPTGCGKTTTLYSCLQHVINPGIKVISVEDPVEYLICGVTQVPVREKDGAGFGRVIRAMLRSDPDVIMVGEIRNGEILQLCCQVALTGHLVLSTLHTDDAASALKRMLDIGLPAFLVADSVRLITAQRLVRSLCPACSKPAPPTHVAWAQQAVREGGLEWETLAQGFRKPVGCKACGNQGYRGRKMIAEMLPMAPAIAAALNAGASVNELRQIAVDGGMVTLAADGIRSAAAGRTAIDEVHRVLAMSMAMR